MKNFAEFVTANREKIYAHAESTTKKNANGDAVISPDDPWVNEIVWGSLIGGGDNGKPNDND